MKGKLFLTVLSLFLTTFISGLKAQSASCTDTSCYGDSLIISTGYDHGSASYQSPLSLEDNWQLVGIPTNAPITLPAPSWVITPNGAWSNFPNAQWVSPFQSNAYNINNPPAFYDPFEFQNCFCVCEQTPVHIRFDLMADDVAEAFIDGILLGSAMTGYHFQYANRMIVDTTIVLGPGTHCLSVELYNTNSVAMGFAVEGSVTGGSLLSALCCNPTGSICGTKHNDLNCDGNVNASDPGLSGWTIELYDNNGNLITSQVTDGNGNYCFDDLPAGTYTVSEVNQSGWVQTFPASPGYHTVNLGAGNTVLASFGNCMETGTICGTKYNDLNCDGNIQGDPGLGGWTIYLQDNNGNIIASQVTSASGSYCFNNIPAGTYTVFEGSQAGWTQTYPGGSGTYVVNVTPGGSYTLNFGNCQQPCEFELGYDVLIEKCGASFTAVIGALPAGYQIVSTVWTFGDGYSSTDLNPVHYYNSPGVYMVCLTVTIFNGQECCTKQFCREIAIEEPCKEDCHMEAEIGVKFDQRTCTYYFTANVLYTGLPITTWFWDFGDGTTATGSTVSHQFPGPGVYTVCLYLFAQQGDDCCFVKVCREIKVTCDPCQGDAGKKTEDAFGASEENILNIFPNPNRGSFNVNFNLAQASAATLSITDMKGVVVHQKDLGNMKAGQQSFNIDVQLAAGTYICRLVTGQQQMQSFLIIE